MALFVVALDPSVPKEATGQMAGEFSDGALLSNGRRLPTTPPQPPYTHTHNDSLTIWWEGTQSIHWSTGSTDIQC